MKKLSGEPYKKKGDIQIYLFLIIGWNSFFDGFHQFNGYCFFVTKH